MSSNNKTLEIIVLGNRAVGKTSLLSSMYMQMEALGVTDCNGMKFSPVNDEEYKILENKWISLRQSIKDNEFTSAPVMPYEGTTEDVEHDFVLSTRNSKHTIRFVDTRGGDTESMSPDLISRIKNSHLMLCVVDASILMQCDQNDNDKLNCPTKIKQILSNVLDDNDSKKPFSCMFILTKCEKYMFTPEDRNRMAARFEKIFSPVLLYAAQKPFKLFYLPVQTMGCVEFSRIDPVTKEMKFKTINKEFQPVDVVFPLAYVLRICLEKFYNSHQNMTWLGKFWQKISLLRKGLPKEDFQIYYEALQSKVGKPVDFRSNLSGSIPRLESINFWTDSSWRTL